MPGGLKQPAKGFKLARGTTLQKANTAKKEAIKFRLLTVFETKTLFVVRNGSCHKNLSGNFIWDNCMSVISLVDEDQMQTQAGRIQQSELLMQAVGRHSEKAKHKDQRGNWELTKWNTKPGKTLKPGNTVCSLHPGPQARWTDKGRGETDAKYTQRGAMVEDETAGQNETTKS